MYKYYRNNISPRETKEYKKRYGMRQNKHSLSPTEK